MGGKTPKKPRYTRGDWGRGGGGGGGGGGQKEPLVAKISHHMVQNLYSDCPFKVTLVSLSPFFCTISIRWVLAGLAHTSDLLCQKYEGEPSQYRLSPGIRRKHRVFHLSLQIFKFTPPVSKASSSYLPEMICSWTKMSACYWVICYLKRLEREKNFKRSTVSSDIQKYFRHVYLFEN